MSHRGPKRNRPRPVDPRCPACRVGHHLGYSSETPGRIIRVCWPGCPCAGHGCRPTAARRPFTLGELTRLTTLGSDTFEGCSHPVGPRRPF